MKKYILIELFLSIVLVVLDKSNMWNTASEFIGAILGTMVIGLIPSYIIAVCITRKAPRIHKIACIIFGIIVIIIGCQKKQETQIEKYSYNTLTNELENKDFNRERQQTPKTEIEKELRENLLEFNKVTQNYNTNTTPEQIEKDIQQITDGMIKSMSNEILSRTKKIDVPDPMLEHPNFLYSKEKLWSAITKQEKDIKNYKENINYIVDDITQGSISAVLSKCATKYETAECEKIKQPITTKLIEYKNKITSVVNVYVDYIEEELKIMRFIDNHYNKFSTTGKFPHFTDNSLQNQFMSKIQELDKKGNIVSEMRTNAWQDAHNQISKL